jgi:hypothetical protein
MREVTANKQLAAMVRIADVIPVQWLLFTGA